MNRIRYPYQYDRSSGIQPVMAVCRYEAESPMNTLGRGARPRSNNFTVRISRQNSHQRAASGDSEMTACLLRKSASSAIRVQSEVLYLHCFHGFPLGGAKVVRLLGKDSLELFCR